MGKDMISARNMITKTEGIKTIHTCMHTRLRMRAHTHTHISSSTQWWITPG